MGSPSSIANFDKLYDKLCDRLRETGESKGLLDTLAQKHSDLERINLLLDTNPSVVSLFTENIHPCYESKNAVEAEALFSEGKAKISISLINRAFRLLHLEETEVEAMKISQTQSHHQHVLEKVATSLPSEKTDASEGKLMVPEILATRAELLLEMKLFEECMRDTIRSINLGQPISLEILIRLALCYKGMGRSSESMKMTKKALEVLRSSGVDNETKGRTTMQIVSIMKELQQQSVPHRKTYIAAECKLFKGKHETIDCASKALELSYAETRGRHVVAREYIPAGSTVIIEEPFMWSIDPHMYESTCQFCLRTNLINSDALPCLNCATVVYCSVECQDRFKDIHSYECKIFKLLNSSEKLGKMALLCFRTFVKIPLRTLLKFHFEIVSSSKPCLGFNNVGQFDSSDYASVYAQTTNAKTRNAGDMLKRSYAAIYLTLCLRFVGHFKETTPLSSDKLSEEELIVASLLLRHLQSASCNAYGINLIPESCDGPSPNKNLRIEEIGGATYPFISTTNHSCNPNIYRFNSGRTCIVNTLRDIHKGEELLDCYDCVFSILPLEMRKQQLEGQYLFTCTCQACLGDWPTFEELRNMKTTTFMCSLCHKGELHTNATHGANARKSKCSECGKTADIKSLQKLLKPYQEKYLRSKESIMTGNLGSTSDSYAYHHKCICDYISKMQNLISSPSKEIIEAQEVLKLFWNLAISKGKLQLTKTG